MSGMKLRGKEKKQLNSKNVLFIGNYRSGSNLFRRLVNIIVKMNDFFLSTRMKTWGESFDFSGYIWMDQLEDVFDELSAYMEANPDLKIIYLSRDNILRQALSVYKVYDTKKRHGSDAGESKKFSQETPEDFQDFSTAIFETCILSIARYRNIVNDFISSSELECLRLYYEADLENRCRWESTLKKVSEFLGIPFPDRNEIEAHIRQVGEESVISSGDITNKFCKAYIDGFSKGITP